MDEFKRLEGGLITKKSDEPLNKVLKDGSVIAPTGLNGAIYPLQQPGPLARQALKRPANYEDIPLGQQWAIDKELGILDWDGDPTK